MNPIDLFSALTDLKAEQERLFVGMQRLQQDHFQQFSEYQVGVERLLVLKPVGGGTPADPWDAEDPAAAGWPPGLQVRLSNYLEGTTVQQTVDEFGMDARLTATEESFIVSTLVWARLALDRKGLPAGYHVLRETTRTAAALDGAFTALRAEIDDLLTLDNPFEAAGPPATDEDVYGD
ncbi:hypothetical protein [Streptomyces sp. NPDC007369]|uniref:hypothetical protein n=1 Tax=Streptomyces sp. NPDC007369 TaxID=3154589 RepID=UPI0033C223CD